MLNIMQKTALLYVAYIKKHFFLTDPLHIQPTHAHLRKYVDSGSEWCRGCIQERFAKGTRHVQPAVRWRCDRPLLSCRKSRRRRHRPRRPTATATASSSSREFLSQCDNKSRQFLESPLDFGHSVRKEQLSLSLTDDTFSLTDWFKRGRFKCFTQWFVYQYFNGTYGFIPKGIINEGSMALLDIRCLRLYLECITQLFKNHGET